MSTKYSNAALLEIATRVLNLKTLDTQRCGLDFQEQAVWGIRQALQEAFIAGVNAQQQASAKPAKATQRAVDVETRVYRNAHGKEPRGFGSWAFQIGDAQATFWCHQATYGEAKKAAQAEARRLNFGHVVVLS